MHGETHDKVGHSCNLEICYCAKVMAASLLWNYFGIFVTTVYIYSHFYVDEGEGVRHTWYFNVVYSLFWCICLQIMRKIKPGMYEYQMESEFLNYVYSQGGMRHVCYTCIAGRLVNVCLFLC